MRRLSLLTALLFLGLPGRGELQAQATGPDWNSARALELVQRARERRLVPQADTSLHNYSARAEGFVYFYLDRPEGEERTLVKTDQVALQLFWAQPNRTKQRIVGMRDQSRLPNRMYYHLDHLTVVQNGFGNTIRMGDGDEVRDVPHPAAPGSDQIYDFRVADSLEIRLGGSTAPIRVYEVNVRPKRTDRPAFVGSMFVDRNGGDIVRMTFTFTPASYVDRRLDFIHVSLDNGLWQGRYWLPNEQQLEIRRQLPELDFAAGAVIMGRMRIADYVFNDTTVPPAVFNGFPVDAVPHAQRESYPFEHDINSDMAEAGLAPPPEMKELRAQAAALLRGRRTSGLPALRLYLPSASSALRYNRAEGLYLGGGITYAPQPDWRADALLGYAFGEERPQAQLQLRKPGVFGGQAVLAGYLNQPRDIGQGLPLAPALNTFSAALLGDDYLDLYFRNGVSIGWRGVKPSGLSLETSVAFERQRSATLTYEHPLFDDSTAFRAVRPIDAGNELSATARLLRPMPDGPARAWSGSIEAVGGTLGDSPFARVNAEGTFRLRNLDHTRTLQLHAGAGVTNQDAPSQRIFLLGGAGTLPGYDYRSFAGSRYALLQAEASQQVWGPWLRLRATAAAGITGGLPATSARAWQLWNVGTTDGVSASAGLGVSLFWDIIRVDRIKGLGSGGRWVFQLSASPDFVDIS